MDDAGVPAPTFDDEVVELEPPQRRRLLAITFHGVPGTANVTRSATTRAWMDQVREQARGLNTHWDKGMRFWARVDFRLHAPFDPNTKWDPDNLLKGLLRRAC